MPSLPCLWFDLGLFGSLHWQLQQADFANCGLQTKARNSQDMALQYTTSATNMLPSDGGCSSDDQSVEKEPADVVKGMVIGFKVSRRTFCLHMKGSAHQTVCCLILHHRPCRLDQPHTTNPTTGFQMEEQRHYCCNFCCEFS